MRGAIDRRSLLGLGLAACSQRLIPDGRVHRVVTLGPSATELIFALGCGAAVVGVSRYDDYPAEVARIPKVGGLIDPSFEAIVALRPDAVMGIRGPAPRVMLDRLASMGVQVQFPPVESLAEIHSALGLFARMLGVAERAESTWQQIDARVTAVSNAVAGRVRPGVLAVFGQRPISCAGPGSFVDELITRAGGTNVVRSGPHWPTLSLEAVLALAPDVVLDMTAMEGSTGLRDVWRPYAASLPAVRDGRVVALSDAVVSRPGPRVGEALAIFARAIHPGLTGV